MMCYVNTSGWAMGKLLMLLWGYLLLTDIVSLTGGWMGGLIEWCNGEMAYEYKVWKGYMQIRILTRLQKHEQNKHKNQWQLINHNDKQWQG